MVGASNDRAKYGNKVFRVYVQNELEVYPVNPTSERVEDITAFPDLASLPKQVHGISVITPPHVTERIIEDAAELGIKHVWMQPGAESDAAIARAEGLGMNVIHGGPCILVTLLYKEEGPS